jgi:MFS family permease
MHADERTPLFDAHSASAEGWRFAVVISLMSLAFANLTSQATRFLLNFLYMETKSTGGSAAAADPHINIAKDLEISPTQFGLLTGPLLMIVAVVASVFTGALADDVRVGPRRVLLGGLVLQGTTMYAQALVQDILSFFVARFVFAVGQGAITAPALTIISQITHEVQRPTANAIFGTGVYLGTGLAASGGILAVTMGWRMTVAIFATLCLLAAAAILLCDSSQEGKGQGADGNGPQHAEVQAVEYLSDIKLKAANMWLGVRVWGSSWSSIGLVTAGCLRFFAGFAAASFLPAFLEGKYGRKTELLTAYGIITATAGVASTLTGGYAALNPKP